MLIVLPAVLIVIMLGVSLWITYLTGREKESCLWLALPLTLLLMSVTLSGELMRGEGLGNPKHYSSQDSSLKNGAVYEVLGAVPVDKEYIVVIRRSDGWTRVYQLKKVPPKVFVKTDNQENPFVPYPNRK